ncbi:thiol:disulfide interchange protein DsbA/DsbL [Rheinheimera baltica]|uniref:thiol:disulfide interchange protein DsbA/DsbL n=1 Tax=Rheinheimera baltica TaxID=67576 RepID=UPI00273DA200|nr:thiol:disulfide interchange protein DsbA/DsbL [Rheinheimera baltica]MDP5190144.1 thiol:disulfide interchange protein DsbA/DsbL [Rheinheimera baltica]
MKKLLCLIAVMLFTPLSFAETYSDGVHYQTLETPRTESKQVLEFFSYYCPHCYNFEPVVQALKATLPEDASFIRAPVPFIGADMGPELQKAYALALTLAAEDNITPALFNVIHQQRKAPRDRDAVRQLFVEQGIDATTFDNNIDSVPVLNQVMQFNTWQQTYAINSVPSFIINGKYKIIVTSVKTQAEFIALVNHVLTLPAQDTANANTED